MFTKKLMLFFMAVLSAVLLTACGGQSAAPKTSAAPGSEATAAAGDKAPAPTAAKAGGQDARRLLLGVGTYKDGGGSDRGGDRGRSFRAGTAAALYCRRS